MSGSTFVDTNVLVYAVDASDGPKQARAQEFLEERDGMLAISAQVLCEFFVVVTRRLPAPLPHTDAERAVAELARMPVVPIDAGLVQRAIAISADAQLSFWDAQIVAAAQAAGCERVATEDMAAGSVIAGVEIENPFASAP